MKSLVLLPGGSGKPHGKSFYVANISILETSTDFLSIPDSCNSFVFFNDSIRHWLVVNFSVAPPACFAEAIAIRAIDRFVKNNSFSNIGFACFFPALEPYLEKFPLFFIVCCVDFENTFLVFNGDKKLFCGSKEQLSSWLMKMGMEPNLERGCVNSIMGVDPNQI